VFATKNASFTQAGKAKPEPAPRPGVGQSKHISDISAPDSAHGHGRHRIEERPLHKTGNPLCTSMSTHIGGSTHSSIQAKKKKKGSALDGSVREPLERSFAQSFGDVRVHNGPRASAATQAAGATAFSSGRDIAFAAGRYDTRSFGGRFLLSHELAHIAQMRSNPTSSTNREADRNRDPEAEHEADHMALNAVIGLGNSAPRRPIPSSSVMYSMLSDSAERIMLSSGGKGQLFDFLRANCPLVDPDLDSILLRLFAAGTDDLWLAQTIVQHGPEPLWPTTAYDERRRRQRDHGWADEAGHIEGVLMTTAGGRNVNAYFFPGTSDERALVVAGVHGSEQGGIEVVEMLLETLRTAPVRPYYSVIVVPTLFPDNAARRRREGTIHTNRNSPDPGQSLTGATPTSGTTAQDTLGNDILPENVALMRLIERFRPTRVASVHGIRSRASAGIFSDAHTISANARARAATSGLSAPLLTALLEADAAVRSQQDENLALDMARAMDTAGHGRAVRGNRLSGTPTAQYGGSTPGGTSFGGWGPQDISEGRSTDRPSMSVMTVEVATNVRSTDLSGSAAARRRLELGSYRDVIQTIFLGPP